MNKNIDILNGIRVLNEERNLLLRRIKTINDDMEKYLNLCQHDLVIKFSFATSHKIGQIDMDYCPICEKAQNIYYTQKIEKNIFKNSKIIDLTDLGKINGNDINVVRQEIINNMDFYYDDNNSSLDLANEIKNNLKTKIKVKKKTV